MRPLQRASRAVADVLVIALFVAVIAAPRVDQWMRPAEARSVVMEYRDASPRPAPPRSLAELGAWPERFDAWYGDTFGLRDRLVRWHNLLAWFGLGQSPTERMVLGRDDWLFYTEDRAIESWRGAVPFAPAELAAWRRHLELRRDWLAAQGIAYLYVIVPDKSAVYGELLPARYERVGPSRREQLLEHLARTSDVRVLDLTPAVRAEKRWDEPGDFVFNRLGTHWTPRGALAGYRALAAEIADVLAARAGDGTAADPRLAPWPAADFALRPSPQGTDDDSWARRMYLDDVLEEGFWTTAPLRPRVARPVVCDHAAAAHEQCWRVEDPSLPSLLLFHDSFGPLLVPHLAQHFRATTALWQPEFDTDLVRRLAPDVVVELYVERALVSRTPAIGGEESAAWLRQRFAASDRVLLDLDLAAGGDGALRAGGIESWRSVRLAPGPDGLEIAMGDAGGLVQLPAVELPADGSAVLALEITSPVDTRATILYRTASAPSYARERGYAVSLRAGRNDVLVALSALDTVGRLLLRPGLVADTYVLHRLEVRAVDLHPELGGSAR